MPLPGQRECAAQCADRRFGTVAVTVVEVDGLGREPADERCGGIEIPGEHACCGEQARCVQAGFMGPALGQVGDMAAIGGKDVDAGSGVEVARRTRLTTAQSPIRSKWIGLGSSFSVKASILVRRVIPIGRMML